MSNVPRGTLTILILKIKLIIFLLIKYIKSRKNNEKITDFMSNFTKGLENAKKEIKNLNFVKI